MRWMRATVAALVAGFGLAIGDADGSPAKVYVADEEAHTVSVIEAGTWKRIATVPVGRGPHNVQISPDGRLAWVTNNGEAKKAEGAEHRGVSGREHEAMTDVGEVWAIDTATDRVMAKVPVGRHPAHVVLTPDGRFAYVTNGGENSVSVVDTDKHRVVTTIPVGAYPHGIRISPDGKEAYVANLKDGTVSVIDTEGRREAVRIPVGKGPAQVGFTADGRLAFVSLSQEDKIAVIDPAARKVLKKITVGTVPIQLHATPDGRRVLVANQGSKKSPGTTVSVVDVDRLQVVKTLETGPGAHGVVIDGRGRHAYITNTYANSISVIDLDGLRVVATVPVGKGPNGISITP